ncbi:DUF1351 domain-containing protein [Oscillibacter ruminantium]|uniref:DUF1351 domain-containing protein n=1 Tax=Oscillibacter ruminantium TaxID=1263547 RepID=UPI00331E7DC7
MELIMTTDLEKSLPQKIDFNYDAIKSELSEKLERYNNLVVTKDSISAAKKDKAALNKLKTALEDRRKEVKKDCLRPYEDFEKKIKELVGMIDAPVLAIDGQIKAFDEIKKAEKRADIQGFYADSIGDLAALLPFDRVFDQRWLNTTYKIDDAQKEITDRIFKTRNDIGIIKAMNLSMEQQVLDVYLRTFDMSAALAEKTRLEAAQKRMEEYDAAQQKAVQEAAQEPKTVVIDGTPGHDFCDLKPGDRVVFGGSPVTADIPQEEPKTIKVIFYDTTEAFRHDMRALTEKYGVRYGGLK